MVSWGLFVGFALCCLSHSSVHAAKEVLRVTLGHLHTVRIESWRHCQIKSQLMMAMVLTIAKEGNVDVFSREFEELLEIGQRPQLV